MMETNPIEVPRKPEARDPIVGMLADDLEQIARSLESCGDYRLLRRLKPRAFSAEGSNSHIRRAVFVDVETTGLDRREDAIIELAMLPFDYRPDGKIVGVGEPYVAFRDPARPIPPSVSALTGITDEMVAGAVVDGEAIRRLLHDVSLVVAHNAAFDRPFCERTWPEFASKAWACSLKEIDWRSEGFEGTRLSHIAAFYGFFFDGHRAADDCYAGIEILTRNLPRSGRPVFAAILDSARTPRQRVRAERAPYGSRHLLKSRGYRWSASSNDASRAWYAEVPEDALDAELCFLRREVYRGKDVEIPHNQVTAFDRYSDRH
jgi:DNA polymerase III subunit epsilon